MMSKRIFLFLASLSLVSASSIGLAAADQRGEQLYKLCTYCHGDLGAGRQELGAPAIAGLPEWYVKKQLANFYEGARGGHPRDSGGLRMSPMARSLNKDTDFQPIAQYVASLPKVAAPSTLKGRVVKGEAAYKVCAACHGERAEGNEIMGAPPLTASNDWYLMTQLHNFKAGIRGGNPSKDPSGAGMRGIALGLTDENMNDVLAYIKILKHKQ